MTQEGDQGTPGNGQDGPVQTPSEPVSTPEPQSDFNPATVDGAETLDSQQLQQVLNYDPFDDIQAAVDGDPTPPQQPPVEQPPQAPPVETPPVQQVQQPQDPTQPQQPPVQQPPVESPELTLMRQSLEQSNQLVAQLQSQMASMQQQQQQPAPQQPGILPQQQQPQADPLQGNYRFQMPAELVNGLASEDANIRSQALTFLVENTGKQIHQQVLSSVQQMIPQQVAPIVQQHQAQAQHDTTVYNDFYGTYPNLNQPQYRPIVREAADAVLARYPNVPWSDQLKAAIGQEAVQRINNLATGMQQPYAQPVPPQQMPPVQPGGAPGVQGVQQQPPFQAAPTTRPPVSSGNTVADEVHAMMRASVGF
ncbi:MAG: hypothetical protein ACR2NL_06895 [Acidimicrobiia bacterium]